MSRRIFRKRRGARHVLLNTGKCKRFRDQLHSFENAAFRVRFQNVARQPWSIGTILVCLFQAAVVRAGLKRSQKSMR